MRARIAEADEGMPRQFGRHWYYWYRRQGQQHRVHARCELSPCKSMWITCRNVQLIASCSLRDFFIASFWLCKDLMAGVQQAP